MTTRWQCPHTFTPVMLPLPTCLAATDSEKHILKRWFDHIVRRVIVGPGKPSPSPSEHAVDEHPPQPPFLYQNHRFTEAFTALRGHQLTGEVSFTHATNVLLEDMAPEWTEPEKRALLRLSLQDASKYTPAFDMSDVVYTVLGSIGTENRLKELCWHRSYPVSDNKTVYYERIHLDTYESYVRPSDCIVPDVAKVLVKEQTFASHNALKSKRVITVCKN